MELELWIDSLQLHDVPPLDYERFGIALESELTRLFTEEGLPPGLHGSSAEIGVDAIHIMSQATAETLGIQLAQSIYEALAR